MSMVLFVLFVTVAVAFVGWPFVRPSEDGEESNAGPALSPLERQKHEALAAIKEAEFDLRMGKLSETDFAALSEKFRKQALAAIAAIEQAHHGAGRESRRGSSERRTKRVAFCPACGANTPPRAHFCGACGRSLTEAVA